MNGQIARGHHRRTRPGTAPLRPSGCTVLAIPQTCDLTIDELREFLADADRAAAAAGIDPGHLRLSAAVRLTGAIKGIWVKIPAGKQLNDDVPGS